MQSTVAELFGLSDRVLIVRHVNKLTPLLKDKQADAGLQVQYVPLFHSYRLFLLLD